jgi:hypothetical protein
MVIGVGFSKIGAGSPTPPALTLPGLCVCGGVTPLESGSQTMVEAVTPVVTVPKKLRLVCFFRLISVPPNDVCIIE